jgi:hypothetical protein
MWGSFTFPHGALALATAVRPMKARLLGIRARGVQ